VTFTGCKMARPITFERITSSSRAWCNVLPLKDDYILRAVQREGCSRRDEQRIGVVFLLLKGRRGWDIAGQFAGEPGYTPQQNPLLESAKLPCRNKAFGDVCPKLKIKP